MMFKVINDSDIIKHWHIEIYQLRFTYSHSESIETIYPNHFNEFRFYSLMPNMSIDIINILWHLNLVLIAIAHGKSLLICQNHYDTNTYNQDD